jgi:5-formyltetrahydrofolate cyclo-ligase
MLDKATIRATMLQRRDSSEAGWRAAASHAIAENAAVMLQKMLQRTLQQNAQQSPNPPRTPVAGYWPIRSEVDPRPLMRAVAALGFPLALPVFDKESMLFQRFAFGDPLLPAPFGTSKPHPSATEVLPGILLVPLAAFDSSGGRLGWGKGHYDRAISRLREGPGLMLALGIAFSFQELERLPLEPYDQPLDCVVTETGLIDAHRQSLRQA